VFAENEEESAAQTPTFIDLSSFSQPEQKQSETKD
jgi:hypothetical protein